MDSKDDSNFDSGDARTTVRSERYRSTLIKRINLIEGQVRGIKGMIEKDVYCDEILNQVASIQSALNSVGKLILENHIHGCLVDRIKKGEDEVVDELIKTIGRML